MLRDILTLVCLCTYMHCRAKQRTCKQKLRGLLWGIPLYPTLNWTIWRRDHHFTVAPSYHVYIQYFASIENVFFPYVCQRIS
jgi:hypothetical protein